MSLQTPDKIRTLQRKLYRKAKAEPAFRFYVLYDKICRDDIVYHAYRLARANAGSPGVDGMTFERIEAAGVQEWLAGLREELVSKTYRPQPVRRVMLPKPGGGERPLGIPTIRDRVVQTAAKLVNEAKTSVRDARQEHFDFLGYTFGPAYFRKDGHWYLGASPSRKSVQRLKTKVGDLLVPGDVGTWPDVRNRLNRLLRGWSAYFGYGTRLQAYRAVDHHVYESVRHFLARRHNEPGRGTRRFSHDYVFGEGGVMRLRDAHVGPPPKAVR